MKNLPAFLILLTASAYCAGQTPTLVESSIPLPAGTAVYKTSGLAYYRHFDGTGSHRLLTTPSKTPYFDTAYAPYGEDYSDGTGSCPTCTGTPEFTYGYMPQDDAASGGIAAGLGDLFFTDARVYSAVQGRFISPDPAIQLSNPAEMNEYAYAGDAPFLRTDASGRQDDGGDWGDDGGYFGGDWTLIYYGVDPYSLDWFTYAGNWWATNVVNWGNGLWNDIPLSWQTNITNSISTYQRVSPVINASINPGGYIIGQIDRITDPDGPNAFKPVCTGCKLRYGDVGLIIKLGGAMATGGMGGIGSVAEAATGLNLGAAGESATGEITAASEAAPVSRYEGEISYKNPTGRTGTNPKFYNVTPSNASFKQVANFPNRIPDCISPTGLSQKGELLYSYYWDAPEAGGFYRLSNHWGQLGLSNWSLVLEDGTVVREWTVLKDGFEDGNWQTGFIKYEDLQLNPPKALVPYRR